MSFFTINKHKLSSFTYNNTEDNISTRNVKKGNVVCTQTEMTLLPCVCVVYITMSYVEYIVPLDSRHIIGHSGDNLSSQLLGYGTISQWEQN